jgi:hypothetical protein
MYTLDLLNFYQVAFHSSDNAHPRFATPNGAWISGNDAIRCTLLAGKIFMQRSGTHATRTPSFHSVSWLPVKELSRNDMASSTRAQCYD